MKTIGLLGGMSWESTSEYYRLINQGIKSSLGGLHSAKIVMYSVDFAEIETLQHQGNWQAAGDLLIAAAKNIEAAGADCLLICTNTMHKVATEVQAAINIPLLHIASATGNVLRDNGISTVALLGTQFTMAQSFYKEKIENEFDIRVLVPNETQQQLVHGVIYQELCLGKINPQSKSAYIDITNELHEQGAQGVILGCTEIGLLLQQNDTHVPLFDTAHIHALSAVNFALSS